MKQPVLLSYNLNGPKARNVHMAAMRLKIRVRNVAKEEYALPLAVLLGAGSADSAQKSDMAVDAVCDPQIAQADKMGNAGQSRSVAQGFSDEMLVMAFFPQGMVNAFLQTMRRAGISPIALKAVLTPTNAAWSSTQLHEELAREHAAMTAREKSAHE